jgi:NAD(P)-dependent dehydrogenase (short-subunit alcohol dehydrogenase family)
LVGRKVADLDSLAAELTARKSGRVTTAVIDFPDVQAIAKLAANHADVDIVVNNAAAIPGGSIQTIPAVVRHSYFVYKLDDFVYGRDDISKIGPLLTIVRGQIEYAAKPFSLLGENATSR